MGNDQLIKPGTNMQNTTAIPKSINMALCAFLVAVNLFSLLVLPVVFSGHPLVMAMIILVLLPVNTPFWSLIHEGIHGNIHPDRAMNERAARGLSILFGAGFQVLKFGHLMHHRYNRKWESEIHYTGQPRWKITINHYFKMLGGVYLAEVLLTLVVTITPVKYAQKIVDFIFADDQAQAVRQMLLKPDAVMKVRIDCAIITILYTVSFYLYGAHWGLLALMIGGRGLIVSLMDNAYHYGTPPDNSVAAKELYLPKLFSRLILNFNYHMTHHAKANLPWLHLPAEHERQQRPYDEHLVPALMAQFKGPIKEETFQNLAKKA